MSSVIQTVPDVIPSAVPVVYLADDPVATPMRGMPSLLLLELFEGDPIYAWYDILPGQSEGWWRPCPDIDDPDVHEHDACVAVKIGRNWSRR